MRFPVEVVSDGPEEVVEVGDVVPQILDVAHHHPHLHHHAVGDVGHLLGEVLHPLHLIDGGLHVVGLFEHAGREILAVLLRQLLGGALHPDHERDRGVLDRGALGPGDGLYPGDAVHREDRFRDLVNDQEVRRVTKVVVAFDHEHFRVHPGLREVPVGGGVALVGRGVGRQIVAVVVVGAVTGQRQQTDQCQRHGGDQDRAGPPHDRGADFAPPAHPHRSLRLQEPEPTGRHHDCAAGGERGDHHHAHPDRQRDSHGLEVGQPGETQTERRPGDGESGAQHHMGGALKHRVVGRFSIFARAARLLVAADQEYRVVRRGGDRQHHQQAGRECRQPDDPVVAEERHHAAR